MRRWIGVLLLMIACSLTSSAAKKDSGTTTLKDVQPAGTTDKENKKQQYDFVFESSGNHYTCRTNPNTSVKATDFVVGSDVKYEVNGNKGELKSTSGKEVKCTVVRVEKVSTPKQ
jgi:hypothetical protein